MIKPFEAGDTVEVVNPGDHYVGHHPYVGKIFTVRVANIYDPFERNNKIGIGCLFEEDSNLWICNIALRKIEPPKDFIEDTDESQINQNIKTSWDELFKIVKWNPIKEKVK